MGGGGSIYRAVVRAARRAGPCLRRTHPPSVDAADGRPCVPDERSVFSKWQAPPGALEISGVGKTFEDKIAWLRRLSTKYGDEEEEEEDPDGSEPEEPTAGGLWAVRDVSFSVAPGDKIAILGSAGAGKSTLLKMLSGHMAPSEGFIEGSGIAIPLSAVEVPLSPQRTGRENLVLIGKLLRFPPRLIDDHIDDIASFSELGVHMDKEVEKYSKNMFSRIGLAMAVSVNPDIILIDGRIGARDPQFSTKFLQRLADLTDRGTSLIFAGGNEKLARSLCNRGLVLASGRLTFDGDIQDATRHLAEAEAAGDDAAPPSTRLTIDGDIDDAIQHVEAEAAGVDADERDATASEDFSVDMNERGKADDRQLAQALSVYEESLRRGRGLAATDPARAEWQSDVLRARERLAYARRRLEPGDAYCESLAIIRRLGELSDFAGAEVERDLSATLSQIANARSDAADYTGALMVHLECLVVRRRFAEAAPDNIKRRRDMIVSLVAIGNLHAEAGDRASAFSAYEEGLTMSRGLASPNKIDSRRQISLLIRVGRLSPDTERSRRCLENALRLMDGLEQFGPLTATEKDWRARIERLLATLSPEETIPAATS